jgi:hypothetical protein
MMIESIAAMAAIQVLLAVANIVNCLWEHDTKTLLPWVLSGLGWFVVVLQMVKQIMEGESHDANRR